MARLLCIALILLAACQEPWRVERLRSPAPVGGVDACEGYTLSATRSGPWLNLGVAAPDGAWLRYATFRDGSLVAGGGVLEGQATERGGCLGGEPTGGDACVVELVESGWCVTER